VSERGFERPGRPEPTGQAFPPPVVVGDRPRSRFDRFQNEVAAGGSVTERPAEDEPTASGWQGVLGALVIVGLFGWLAFVNMWMFVFAVGVLLSVFLHETGHFVTARMTGMKATQFFLGFGPRIWSFRRGETEYGVRALPLGAFVRIIGMNNLDEVPTADEARTYRQQTFPRRLLVITAGSLMHLLIAVVLLFGVYATRGELTEIPGAEVAALQSGGPAEAAGIEDGDILVAVGGEEITDADELGEIVRANEPGDVVDVVVERDGEQLTIPVALGANTDTGDPDLEGTALLGVGTRGATEWQSKSLVDAAGESVTDLFPVAWESTKGVVQVLNPVNIWNHLSGETEDPETRPTTLVGVTQASGSFGETLGIAGVVFLLAVLNVFVGVFNMFPLLPLDGGHAAIAIYERARERNGRRYFADVSKLMPYAVGVIMVLALLFFSGLYLDVTKPLG
jgi:membrane-associated protease RseP (regulator of RpoE activity)